MRWVTLALVATSLSLGALTVFADDAKSDLDLLEPVQQNELAAEPLGDAELVHKNDRNAGRGWLERLFIACGFRYALLLPLSLLLSVWLIVVLTRRESPHNRSALLGLTILLPFFVGIYSMFDGFASVGFGLMRNPSGVEGLSASVIGENIWQLMVPVMLSMLLTFVAFVVAHIRMHRLPAGPN